MYKHAVISACETYRYQLTRQWDGMLPILGFIMLNPSTADAHQDDPTIRKCIGFAQRNGFGSVNVVNLYAFRATDPSELRRQHYRVGPLNDVHIVEVLRDIKLCQGKVVCAWGSHARNEHRIKQVVELIKTQGLAPHYLKLTKEGQPSHPLMLSYSNPIQEWNQ